MPVSRLGVSHESLSDRIRRGRGDCFQDGCGMAAAASPGPAQSQWAGCWAMSDATRLRAAGRIPALGPGAG